MLEKVHTADTFPWWVKPDCKADFIDNKLLHLVQMTAENQEGLWINVGWSTGIQWWQRLTWVVRKRPLQTHQVCHLVLFLWVGLGLWRSTFILCQLGKWTVYERKKQRRAYSLFKRSLFALEFAKLFCNGFTIICF